MRVLTDIEKERLASCHKDLQTLFNEVLKTIDVYICEGYRNKESQNKAYNEGKSKLKYPDGKHNGIPSMAVDIAPYPIDWSDKIAFYHVGGFIQGVASALYHIGKMKYQVRWGGDWDCDNDLSDQVFNDLGHFELIEG